MKPTFLEIFRHRIGGASRNMRGFGRVRGFRHRLFLACLFFASLCLYGENSYVQAWVDEIEREPIQYDSAPATNAISKLEAELKANPNLLDANDTNAFLRALLRRLAVLESSQTLVFSKTSLQLRRIRPDRPRAIYFSDDVYVAYCQDSSLFEISAVDAKLGAVFYSTDFEPGKTPLFKRHNDSCMICHGSSSMGGYPGHLVRSVYADSDGNPLFSMGSSRVTQQTPLKQRWGGWYVTGKSGSQSHLGNRIFTPLDRDRVDPQFLNRESIDDLIDRRRYLHGHSDIVALMVLEHQAEMQNLLTRAGFQTRIGMDQDRQLNKELKYPPDRMSDTTWRRIQSVGDQVVRYMLYSDEATLADPISGSSTFAKDFAARGKRDKQGRSLRDFDLQTRVFKYPCSYLIHSEQFEGMPAEVKDYIYRRLYDILTGKDTRAIFAHLSAEDRRAILEIVRDTTPNLPAYWRD